jgi:hypothetical protein
MHSTTGAEHWAAPDCLQRPLRSRFRQQVSPGVRPHNKDTQPYHHLVV